MAAAAQKELQEPEVLPPPEKLAGPASSAPPAAAPTGALPLTLPQALETSLAQNPDLVALRGQINVNEAMVGVAKTYIWNPFVQAQYFPNGTPFVPATPGQPASGAGMSNFYVWVMQRFELAHQRQFRTKSALAALDQTQWNIFQAELLNVARTTSLYFAAVYQKELYELAAGTAALNEHFAGIVERRFRANLARAADLTAARIAARQSRRAAELAENTYRAALLALYQQLNLPLTTPLDLRERLETVQWLPPCSEVTGNVVVLAAELVEGRPDIMAAEAGFRVAEANWRLARAAMVPDLQAGTIYETADDGTRYLGMRLQMDIPVWNTGAPLARQRKAEMNQAQLSFEQLKARACLEAEAAIDQYEHLRAEVAKEKPVQAQGMPPELQEITRLFEAGQADILAVLGTQATLLQERRLYLDLLNQLAVSAAAVIQFTGLPPERVIQLPNAGHCHSGNNPTPVTISNPAPPERQR